MCSIRFVPLLVLTLSATGCHYEVASLTVVSTRTHELPLSSSEQVKVSGESLGVFGIGASVETATARAMAQAGPQYDLLINCKVRVRNYVFYRGYEVSGTAARSAGSALREGNWPLNRSLSNPGLSEPQL